MAARLPKAARDYLAQLRRALDEIEHPDRAAIVEDARIRLAKLPGRGRHQRDILAAFGPADSYAAGFSRVQPEALQVSSGHEFLVRILMWPTFAFALLTAAVVLFSPGAVLATSLEIRSLDSMGFTAAGPAAGWPNLVLLPAALVALVPAVFSLTPLIIQGKAAAWLQLLGAVVMSAVAVMAGAGIGLMLLPAVILLWCQLLVPPVMMRNSMGRPGVTWRIVGAIIALLALVPVGLSLAASGLWWLLVIPGAVLVPIAGHLFRRQWADIALIAVGLATIVLAAVAAPLLTPVFLIGSWLFIVGHLGVAGNMWHARSASLLALL